MEDVRPRKVTSDTAIDDIDRRLLRALSDDARLSNSALAKKVGIAASTCHFRVRRLVDRGVIRGFRLDIAPEALGYGIQALVAVRLQPTARGQVATYAAGLARLPGVLNVYFLAGIDDFEVHVAAASADDLRGFVTNLSKAREVASTQTSLIFEHTVGSVGIV
nr:Lrp/AsnC family transcriptional regulator [Flexivirga oryzae]